MICKNHPDDCTSAVGVCASCLHDRLIALMAAQVQLQLQLQDQDQSHRRSDTRLLPPRSVPRRNEEFHQRRFDSTPLAGPALVGIEPGRNTTAATAGTGKKNKKKSLFWGLFRSKSDNSNPCPDPGLTGHDQFNSCMASPAWFPTIIPASRRKQRRTFSLDENIIGGAGRNPCCRRNRGRGMSPARCSDDDEEDGHFRGGSSGYSSESSQGWKQTPQRTPARARRSQGKPSGHIRNVSGLAFCLSPLVRPCPNRQWNQKGIPPEIVVVTGSPAAAAFCKNRSRKIADYGRQSFHTRRR